MSGGCELSNSRSTTRRESKISIEPVKLRHVFSAPITPGATVSVIFYPPAGRTGKVLSFYAYASSLTGGTSGTHYFLLSDNTDLYYMQASSDRGTSLIFRYGYWTSADNYQYPSSALFQSFLLTTIRFAAGRPLAIYYSNPSDATQNTDVVVEIAYEEAIR